MFRRGDIVVYTKTKHSSNPGPRAQDIDPATRGEYYTYVVDKYWIVVEVEEQTLRVRTRRGKVHTIKSDDPRLRAASWWERLFFRDRFPAAVSV